jgi:phosphate starvation-inducible protein PhoH and related proteins
MSTHALQRRINLSKRKTSALRTPDTRFSHTKRQSNQTFYTNESKTIDFSAHREHKVNKRPVELVPKSLNQEKYIMALLDDSTDIVVITGPAGTGKTYLAMQAAIKAMRSGECDRIILTRPAVGVDDEKHGFLPGDINQKMEPWTRPLLDVLREYYTTAEITHMLEEQIVEIAPLAFCRGRNFKNSWIVLDEAQNATGDIEQTDRKTADNGLLDLQNRLRKGVIPGLQLCHFELKDVQRHKIIEHVLKLYS